MNFKSLSLPVAVVSLLMSVSGFAGEKITNCVLGAKIYSEQFNQIELEITPHQGPGITLEIGKTTFGTGFSNASATNGNIPEFDGTRLRLLDAVAIDHPSATRTVYGVKLGLNPTLAAKYNSGVAVLYTVCTEDETSSQMTL